MGGTPAKRLALALGVQVDRASANFYWSALVDASPISVKEMSSTAKSFQGPDVFGSNIARAAVVLVAADQLPEYLVHTPGVGFAVKMLPTALEFTYAWKVGSD